MSETARGRVCEQFQPGEAVLIRFGKGRVWEGAEVIASEPPGLWVRTGDGHSWFVTSNRRIKKRL